MTSTEIQNALAIQTAIHEAARQAAELIEAASNRVTELGGDGDEATTKIHELLTED